MTGAAGASHATSWNGFQFDWMAWNKFYSLGQPFPEVRLHKSLIRGVIIKRSSNDGTTHTFLLNMAPQKPVDFHGSARRHLADADLLESNNRIPNAGHLYGYVAECGLKALLIGVGYPTDLEGSPAPAKPSYRVHIDRLLAPGTFESLSLFLNGRTGAKYLALISRIGNFSDWRVEHRYYSEAALPGSLSKWKTAAHEIGRMLDQARTYGVIP